MPLGGGARMTFIVRRILGLVPILVLTWTAVFIVFELIPGDPVNLMLAGVPASEEVIANERARLGLDRPPLERYFTFLARAATGDLGESFRTRQPVTDMILDQLGPTLQLAGAGLVVGLTVGLFLGVLAGLRPGSWLDTTCTFTALAGSSLPSFWTGMLLIYVFGSMLGWVPIVGSGFDALILPAIVTGLFIAGDFARLVRTSIIDASRQDYIRTARAKGLSPVKIVGKHALRNALIPPVTMLGIQLSNLIGGAVVTENVFARPGLGTLLVDAVLNKDLPLVQALVVYTTAAYLVINLIIDILYGLIDPRIRHSRRVPT
jgi:ABC-type dipeptide/oligopeptide/nickel transport system permease component